MNPHEESVARYYDIKNPPKTVNDCLKAAKSVVEHATKPINYIGPVVDADGTVCTRINENSERPTGDVMRDVLAFTLIPVLSEIVKKLEIDERKIEPLDINHFTS